MTREEKAARLLSDPLRLSWELGYKDFKDLHGQWMYEMLTRTDDMTLQAHRGSYKTTCLSVVIALLMITQRSKNIIFLRKTDTDVHEVIKNVNRILKSEIMQQSFLALTGDNLIFTKSTYAEISTNCYNAPRGSAQLLGMGIGSSLTGKHADIVITDDIVNLRDRKSKADREATKSAYMELQNVKNPGGRIINCGTPWHPDDAFSIMPAAERYDVYRTGMLSEKAIEDLRAKMTKSLFAANYELRHIASDDVIFTSPKTGADPANMEQGMFHIDAAYGGEDGTAMTGYKKKLVTDPETGEKRVKHFILGKLWHKHVDDCLSEIIAIRQRFNGGHIFCEDNGDKGYLGKELRNKGERVIIYHENMNKFIKITTYLKAVWPNVEFIEGTDPEYINQICDYNEDADHDDAPDSAASIVRAMWNRKTTDNTYQSILR